jgi:hypothetical protein
VEIGINSKALATPIVVQNVVATEQGIIFEKLNC